MCVVGAEFPTSLSVSVSSPAVMLATASQRNISLVFTTPQLLSPDFDRLGEYHHCLGACIALLASREVVCPTCFTGTCSGDSALMSVAKEALGLPAQILAQGLPVVRLK